MLAELSEFTTRINTRPSLMLVTSVSAWLWFR